MGSGNIEVPILSVGLGWRWGQGNMFSAIPWEKHNFALHTNQSEQHGRLYKYGGEKNFFQLMVFVPQKLQPSESIGILKVIFGFCGQK